MRAMFAWPKPNSPSGEQVDVDELVHLHREIDHALELAHFGCVFLVLL